MKKITIWHNPRCSKSRDALKIVDENNIDKEVVKYLEETPNKKELETILQMLDITPRELMRTKETIYKELNLKDITDNTKLIEAMVKHPKLIERPILIKGDKAIIGRPTSIVSEFVNS